MEATMFGMGFLLLISLFNGGLGLPLGVPPVEDPLMTKVAPAECLAYISWAGMGVPDAKSKNSTEAMMAGAEVQRILAQVDKQLTSALLAIPDGDEETPEAVVAQEGVPLGRLLLSRPAAIFLERIGEAEGAGPDFRGGALVNLGKDTPEVQASLEKLQAQFLKEAVKKVDVAGMPASQISLGGGAPEIFWAVKGSYLFVGVGPGSLEGILARGRAAAGPKWLTDLRGGANVERVSSVIHIDVGGLNDSLLPLAGPAAERLPGVLAALGVDNVKSLDLVAGLDKEGWVSQTKLSFTGEARGLLTAVSDKPLSPLDLEPIPADSTVAIAARADAMEIYSMFREVAGRIAPGAEDEIERELRRVEEQTGLRIIDGIFGGLGDVWCAYNSPSEGGLVFTGLTATVSVRDHAKLKTEYEKIHKLLSDEFERQRGFRGGSGPRLKEIEFAGEKIHYITGERDFILALSFCLTKDYFIFALFPQNIQALLSRGKDFQSLATSADVGPHMKMDGGASVIVYQDTRELFKLLYPLVPMMGQIFASEMSRGETEFDLSLLPSVKAIAPHLNPGLTAIARTDDAIILDSRNSLPGGIVGTATPLALGTFAPAIRQSWETAGRAQSSNNLKQIALALHNYHDTHRHFPPAFTVDKGGKPLLSWRVAILPYLEQNELYEEFRQDEPWDSEHNKKLLARMPAVFQSRTSKAKGFKTVYLAPRVERAVLSGAKVGEGVEKVTMAHVRDGTSNTIMVLEASDARAVEWTKPDDLAVDKAGPTAGIVGQHKQGFLAAFTDGSVQFLSPTIDGDTMLNLFDRADGNVIDYESLQAGSHGGRRGSSTVRAEPPIERAPAEDFPVETAPEPEFESPVDEDFPVETVPLDESDAAPAEPR